MDRAHTRDGGVERSLEVLEHLRAASGLRRAQEQRGGGGVDAELGDLALESDEIAVDELGEDVLAPVGVDREPVEQRRIQGGVSESDSIRLESRRVERLAQDGEDLRRPFGGGSADQLDPGLEELARLS